MQATKTAAPKLGTRSLATALTDHSTLIPGSTKSHAIPKHK